MNLLLEEYLNRKICLKCSSAQSSLREFCFKKNCKSKLRYRKKLKK